MPNRLCCSRLGHDTQAAANNFNIFCSARRRHLIAHFFKNRLIGLTLFDWTDTVRGVPGHQLGHGSGVARAGRCHTRSHTCFLAGT